MFIDSGLILISLIFLYYGGEFLVTGSLRLAQTFNISPFIIGATVIGFGTSTPELAVSLMASIQGSGDLALANIIGSNITNIGLVLGLTALIIPLTIEKQRYRTESPSLIITSTIIVVFSWDSYLSRIEGFIMISFFSTNIEKLISLKSLKKYKSFGSNLFFYFFRACGNFE